MSNLLLNYLLNYNTDALAVQYINYHFIFENILNFMSLVFAIFNKLFEYYILKCCTICVCIIQEIYLYLTRDDFNQHKKIIQNITMLFENYELLSKT